MTQFNLNKLIRTQYLLNTNLIAYHLLKYVFREISDFPDKSILFSTQPFKNNRYMYSQASNLLTLLSLHSQRVISCQGLEWPPSLGVVPPSSEWHLPLPPFNHGFQALVLFLLLDCKLPQSRKFISIYFCIPSLQSLTKYLDRVDTPTTGKIQSNQNQPFDHILIPLYNVWRKENIMEPQNMWFLLSMKSKFRSVQYKLGVLLLRSCSVVEWTNCCHSETCYFCNLLISSRRRCGMPRTPTGICYNATWFKL